MSPDPWIVGIAVVSRSQKSTTSKVEITSSARVSGGSIMSTSLIPEAATVTVQSSPTTSGWAGRSVHTSLAALAVAVVATVPEVVQVRREGAGSAFTGSLKETTDGR